MINLEEFKNWLILNKSSKYTVKTYYNKLKTFFNKYSDFSQETVNEFLKEKIENKSKGNTVNLYIYAFKSYSEFSEITIKLPNTKRVNSKIQSYINEQDLNDICVKLNILTNNYDKWSVILKVLFYTGLRLKEITELKRENIDLNKKIILVQDTKNQEERIIPFSDNLKQLLINYFESEIENINAFNSTRKSIEYICKQVKDNFEIDFHPHTLRHSACHYLLKITNNNYDVVQKIMGHKDIKQTIAYSSLNSNEMINLMQEIFKNEDKKKRKK